MNMKYVVVLVTAIAGFAAVSEAAEYTVGDDMGWMVPPTPDYYAKWASKYYFVANDTLDFNFAEGVHDITVLSKEDFDSCNMASPLAQFPDPGALTVMASDTFYFTCSFGQHCLNGQKVAITFASSPMPPMPSPSPSPSASASAGSDDVQSDSESKTFKFVSAKKEKKTINGRKMISLTMA